MTNKINNQHPTPPAQLEYWDCGADTICFVTICTNNCLNFFGEIENNIMQLSVAGIIAQQYWLDIPIYFPNALLDVHVVMPNHLHGVLIFDNKTDALGTKSNRELSTLAVIINHYKRIVATDVQKIDPSFEWQPRFYDHIIRDRDSYQFIQKYIQENPLRWREDMFYGG